MTVTVYAEELQYVDRAAGHDKFYRVYQWDTIWTIQYGRNGTYGTFSRKVASTKYEAQALADKQVQAKYSKGYESVKTVTLEFPKEPTDSQLDSAMSGPGNPVTVGTRTVTDKALAKTVASLTRILTDTSTDLTVNTEILNDVIRELSPWFPKTSDALEPEKALRPMLAEEIHPNDVEGLLIDDNWGVQYKLDGERYVVEVTDGQVAVYNRQGQPKVSNVAPETLTPFYDLTEGYWVFDGELIGRTLWLFDMPAAGGYLHREAPFQQRHDALVRTLTAMKCLESPNISLVDNIVGTDNKRLALQQASDDSREGIMFRKLSARYQFGRRTLDLMKYKFIKTADVYVTRTGIKGKSNAELAVLRDGKELVVGQVSTIGKGEVDVGDVLEVKFLYVIDPANPKLYQPRILRKRDDKAADECFIEQFVNAGTNKEMS